MRLSSRRLAVLLSSTLVSSLAALAAQGAEPSQPTHLVAAGPISPETNFPFYFQDHTGLALALCTAHNDVLGLCISDPPDPADPYQQQTGFGSEGFWWAADAAIDMVDHPSCGGVCSAHLVLAVEAAYNQEVPLKGDEFTFGRVRIRIDAPVAGRYLVKHPFGEHVFTVDAPGVRVINESMDIGSVSPDYSGPLRSGIMSFLIWDPEVGDKAPDGYIGDPNVPHEVIGSPLGQNYFSVTYLDDANFDLSGTGSAKARTDLFAVSGLKFNGQVPVPVTVRRATSSNGHLEVKIDSSPAAYVTVTSRPNTDPLCDANPDPNATPIPLHGDGKGGFYLVEQADVPPGTGVQIRAQQEGNADTTLCATVADVVRISNATFEREDGKTAGTLRVTAQSDAAPALGTAGPELALVGLDAVADANGVIEVPDLSVPPAAVVVRSSWGGEAQVPVKYMSESPVGGSPPPSEPDQGANLRPIAQDDAAETPVGTQVTINVAANDSDPEGNLVRASVKVIQPPKLGTIGLVGEAGINYTPGSALGPGGSDSFTYVIYDSQGGVSNEATVVVTVIDEALRMDSATYRTSTSAWRVTGTTTAVRDNVIEVWLGRPDTGSLIGTALADNLGAYDMRATANDYTRPGVRNPSGTINPTTVSIRSAKGTTILDQPVTITFR